MTKLAFATKAADIAQLLHSDQVLMSNMHKKHQPVKPDEMQDKQAARRSSDQHEDARKLLRLIESAHPDHSDASLWRRIGRATIALWIIQGWSLRRRKYSNRSTR